MTGFWRPIASGVSVAVKAQPKSRRPGLRGTAASAGGKRLIIGVTEAAENGRANLAVCIALADVLGVPPSAVRLVIGATSREKTLHVTGDPVALGAKLDAL